MRPDSNAPAIAPEVLVWDRKPVRITQIQRALGEAGITIHTMERPAKGEFASEGAADVTLVSLGQEPGDQEVALSLICTFRKSMRFVFAFEDGTSRWPLAVRCRALLAGAKRIFDSEAPEFLSDLRLQVLATLREISLRTKEEGLLRQALQNLGVVAESSAMMSVGRLVVRVSRLSDLPLLLSGETGTGKELLARATHALDPKRSRGPFVALNCAAVPPDLAEAELFGHRRGAFTGAEYDRKGLFRAAEGGVIFLDEIAELRLDLQGKLLRVLQENRLLVLGEDRETTINVRLLAATNRDLRERVAQGGFRADLFYRLNVIPIHVPPLRERPEDIAALVSHFLQKHRHLNPAISGKASPEFIHGLQSTGLPGNARQVENVVRQAIARKEDDAPLGLADLPCEVWEELAKRANATAGQEKPPTGKESMNSPTAEFTIFPRLLLEQNEWNLSRTVRHFERLLLDLALHHTHGNQSETARLLGLTPRSVYNKLRHNPS